MSKIIKRVITILIIIIYITAMVFVWRLLEAITVELADDFGLSDTMMVLTVTSAFIIYACIAIMPLMVIVSALNFKKEENKIEDEQSNILSVEEERKLRDERV